MDKNSGQLTVYFEDPFWVGVFERISAGKLSVCKVTFGAEPKDCELLEFIMNHYYDLSFSPSVDADIRLQADNPKRRMREARKQMHSSGISTKSQMALQLQREEMKTERKLLTKELEEEEARRQFLLKQQKRKEKQKGH